MPHDADLRQSIQAALCDLAHRPLADTARALLATLGYRSERTIDGLSTEPAGFLAAVDRDGTLAEGQRAAHALLEDWQEVCFLFQLTDAEINDAVHGRQPLFAASRVDEGIIQSYLFLAVRLSGSGYTRTRLAAATREINRLFPQPVLVLFLYDDCLTVSIIARRRHKRDAGRDVLEKVTLIKDISIRAPHRGHVDILHDLALGTLARDHPLSNWSDLQRAWEQALDASVLNRRFYREVANWFFWARDRVRYPDGAGEDEETRNSVSLIRLITRLIFVWFLREKGLVPDDLFREDRLRDILTDMEPDGSTYYKAILQNLFFATLNQEMGKRGWRGEGRQHYNVTNLYRYRRFFRDADEGLALFASVPFLNGGLFECLDKMVEGNGDKVVRVDGFSDREDNVLSVPNDLFFGPPRTVDLNRVFGSKGKRYEVRGLIRTLDRFKFTVEENTPLEEEVALDPELLGQVFENLLASYNPETGTTARKQSGSFYTPREVVDYMVDEALVAYLSDEVPDFADGQARLRRLLSYGEEDLAFSDEECARLVRAIDRLRALDPACGSGAFPMGILHKAVHVLRRLDPENVHWRRLQRERAAAEANAAFDIADQEARQARLLEIDEAFQNNLEDYGRKLYLIENGIYGVDIQPIAVQIAKLRFFIALVVDQRVDDARPNRGIRPLPNLETRFVAANSLLDVRRPDELDLKRTEVDRLERALRRARERHFAARTPETKRKYRDQDRDLRTELADVLRRAGVLEESARLLAQWDPYDQNASAPFFDPEWMFGIREGFDIVIGNPPYVRGEKIKALKPDLARRYTCYTGTADLYVYFYERGLRLLRQGGVLVYISSNKYFRSGYGEGLRRHLASHRIETLIDFGDAPVFASIAYPSIIVVRKEPGCEGETVRALTWSPGRPLGGFVQTVRSESFTLRQDALSEDGWRLQDEAGLALLDKIQNTGKPLGAWVQNKIYRGIVTGLNEAFVVDRATRDRLIAEDPSSEQLLKPMLRGRDVKRWRFDFPDLWLISARRGVDIDRYPAVRRHLEKYRARLTPGVPGGRKPGAYKWYEIQDPIAFWQEFEKPKIVWGNLATSPGFALVPAGYTVCVPANIIVPGSRYLLGILNSSLIHFLVAQSAAGRAGGFMEYKPMYIRPLPIVDPPPEERVSAIVDEILSASAVGTDRDLTELEDALNEEVYRLYGLSDAEIATIESAVCAEPDQAAVASRAD